MVIKVQCKIQVRVFVVDFAYILHTYLIEKNLCKMLQLVMMSGAIRKTIDMEKSFNKSWNGIFDDIEAPMTWRTTQHTTTTTWSILHKFFSIRYVCNMYAKWSSWRWCVGLFARVIYHKKICWKWIGPVLTSTEPPSTKQLPKPWQIRKKPLSTIVQTGPNACCARWSFLLLTCAGPFLVIIIKWIWVIFIHFAWRMRILL